MSPILKYALKDVLSCRGTSSRDNMTGRSSPSQGYRHSAYDGAAGAEDPRGIDQKTALHPLETLHRHSANVRNGSTASLSTSALARSAQRPTAVETRSEVRSEPSLCCAEARIRRAELSQRRPFEQADRSYWKLSAVTRSQSIQSSQPDPKEAPASQTKAFEAMQPAPGGSRSGNVLATAGF
jgi:hypothetical protein